jgi:hypothetical protein
MPVPEKDPARRGDGPQRNWKLDGIELSVLIPLLLAANCVIATIAWYAVGAFLK